MHQHTHTLTCTQICTHRHNGAFKERKDISGFLTFYLHAEKSQFLTPTSCFSTLLPLSTSLTIPSLLRWINLRRWINKKIWALVWMCVIVHYRPLILAFRKGKGTIWICFFDISIFWWPFDHFILTFIALSPISLSPSALFNLTKCWFDMP